MAITSKAWRLIISVLVGWLAGFGSAWSQTSGLKLAPDMQSLTKALAGQWSLNVEWEPGPATPKKLVNTGTEIWRPGPGGSTLIEEEHVTMPAQELFLLGVVWWDAATKNLRGMDCQNLLPYTCDIKGAQKDITMSWDGKQFGIDEIETSKTGEKSVWHETWSDIRANSFVQTGEYGPPQGPRKKLFTIRAARISVNNQDVSRTDPAKHGGPGADEPAPEMKSLAKALSGEWFTTYAFEPGEMSPTGGNATGEETWRTGPGGYVLMEEEHIKGPTRDNFLMAFQWWDKTTNRLRGMLCNNSGPAACSFITYSNSSLKWDGKQLTVDLEFPQGNKRMLWHEVWSDITATSFTQTGEMGEVDGPLKLADTIHGTKVAEHSPGSTN